METLSSHSTVSLPKASLPEADAGTAAILSDAQIPSIFSKTLDAVFFHAPYLARAAEHHPDIVAAVAEERADSALRNLMGELRTSGFTHDTPDIMRTLRIAKTRIALLVGLCDLLKHWSVAQVTNALSDFADLALAIACDHLLHKAHEEGELALHNPLDPSADSGFIILGMGKLGGNELNYSSDIDLILLFDKECLHYTGKHGPQRFFNRMAQDLVRILQERTSDGYVFRTDLRLRPDPASTPPVNSIAAAITYYETVGQNWERAALIKARPVAGDIRSGQRFLRDIHSFIWRKHLDFAAIADIQSIRRQMKGQHIVAGPLLDYDIKLGSGGIREIEFFTQIHQLIWGGRMPQLRGRSTCEVLAALADEGKISPETALALQESYRFYRQIEHRLQMRNDEQTHSLPALPDDYARFAQFCGFETAQIFSDSLRLHLTRSHTIYRDSFRGDTALSDKGNLVFTGADHDQATLVTIRAMGYRNAEAVSDAIRSWHHGSRRATRTKRARELITELTPALLKAFAATADPDEAFLRFDHFITTLPAGIQLFSLFQMNATLLSLIAEIFGNAPALAEMLSRQPILLDSVLSSEFHQALPDADIIQSQLASMLEYAVGYEEAMSLLVQFRQEKSFQSGVRFLRGMASQQELQRFLTHLAECTLTQAVTQLQKEFHTTYGRIPDGEFGILSLGRLGAGEVAYHSDLDIVFLYHAADDAVSDGEKSVSASVYYNRLAQRITGAVTALTRHGRLYEIDTRLRPSGKDGPLAVSLAAFEQYFVGPAWNFERMALCKGRFIYGNGRFLTKANVILQHQLEVTDTHALRGDIAVMRQKIAAEFDRKNIWDVKHAVGGLMDIDFLAEYLILAHSELPLQATASERVFAYAAECNLLSEAAVGTLAHAIGFQNRLLNLLRICAGAAVDPAGFATGPFIARHMGCADLKDLEKELVMTQKKASMIVDACLFK